MPEDFSFDGLREAMKVAVDDEIARYINGLESSWKILLESQTLDVLADRYATGTRDIFSPRGKILSERELWIAVMKAQRELGLNIPGEDIGKYEAAKGDIDLSLIREIEAKTKHDVKAKIEAFVKAAGAREHIHRGMTSRDLTDNVEQMQNRAGARLIYGRYVSVLRHLVGRANEYRDIILTARTHHQAAQPTLLGRRLAMNAEELMMHLPDFETFVENYPLRGIKGPVGTQFDMAILLGSPEKAEELERKIAQYLGFVNVLNSPGQVYFRSLDYKMLSHLACLSAACENFGINMRLMAGYELVTEGFSELQTGSTAMPHKRNTRSSERVCSAAELLKMYADGVSQSVRQSVEEGDVSDSMIRRVILPGAFYTSDGLCETMLTVLNDMGAYPDRIQREVERYMPFLASTQLLSIATKAGMGRERAHEIIKGYAMDMWQRGGSLDGFVDSLSQDSLFVSHGVEREKLKSAVDDKERFVANARRQTDRIYQNARIIIEAYPKEAAYEPGPIL